MDEQRYLKKLQREELDILLVIQEFCRKNDIEWFLMSGTALGALRHKGFIPWDDDIDIGMLRDQYDRFIELAEDGLPEGYSLHTHKNTDGFACFFAKVYRDGTIFQTAETEEAGCPQGIFVDIFPFDRVSSDSAELKKQIRAAMIWQRISYLYHSRVINVPHQGAIGAIERAGCWLSHYAVRLFFSPESISDHFDRLINRGGPDEASCYLALSWPYVEPLNKAVLCPPTYAQFEEHSMPVPQEPERYLTIWYGDWQTLPSPENRHTHLPKRIVFSDGETWQGN